tara:strand:- start:1372 stop:5058 length:3687 start_codon:yes stop_codon:yes gene_type:complete
MSEELDYSLVPSDESTLNQIQPIDLTKSEGVYDLSTGVETDPIAFQNLFSTFKAPPSAFDLYPKIPKELQFTEIDINKALELGVGKTLADKESELAFNLLDKAVNEGILTTSKPSTLELYNEYKADGITDRDLITHFTGVEDIGSIQATIEGIIRGGAVAVPSTIIGAGAFTLSGGPMTPGLSIPAALTATTFSAGVIDNIINNFFPEQYFTEDVPFVEAGKTASYFGTGSVFAKLIPTTTVDKIMASSNKILNNIKSGNLFKRIYEKSKGKALEYLGGGLKLGKDVRPFTEATAVTSASIAAGTAEKVAPDNLLVRLPAEIVAYSTNPVGRLALDFPIIRTAIRKAQERLSKEGQTVSAAKTLNKIVDAISKKDIGEKEDFTQISKDLMTVLSKDMQELVDSKELNLTAAEKQAFVALLDGREPSKSLQVVQQMIMKEDPGNVGAKITQQQSANLKGLQRLLTLLVADGDPELISAAAKVREGFFSNLLEGQVGLHSVKAVDLAEKSAERIGKAEKDIDLGPKKLAKGETVSEKNASEAGVIITDLINSSLKKAREVERALYREIDRNVVIDATPFITAYMSLLNEGTANYIGLNVIPKFLKADIFKITEGNKVIPSTLNQKDFDLFKIGVGQNRNPKLTLDELLNLRKSIRAEAQALRADPTKQNAARIISNLDESILESIGAASKSITPVGGMTEKNTSALRTAFAYSKALNDVYTRTAVGDITRSNRQGGEFKIPELLFEQLDGDKFAEVFRNNQIEDAITFLLNKDYPEIINKQEIQDNLTTLLGNQNLILRQALGKKVVKDKTITDKGGNKKTISLIDSGALKQSIGTVENPTAYGEMIKKNFPELYSDLLDANKTATIYKNLDNKNNIFNKQLKNVISFKNFLGKDNPNKVIAQIIGGTPGTNAVAPNAERNLKRIARMVSRPDVDPATKNGFLTSLIDFAMRNATDANGALDFEKLNNFLYTPLSKKSPSIMQILRSDDLLVKNAQGEVTPFITQDTFNKFKELITLGRTLQKFQKVPEEARVLEEAMKKNTEGMFILSKLLRVLGARTGANVFSFVGMGGTLQAPAIGADIAVRQFEKYFPSLFSKSVFIQAILDPEVMAKLTRSTSVVNRKYSGKNLIKLLNSLGIQYADGMFEDDSESIFEPPSEDLEPVPQNVTQAPRVPQQVAMATPSPVSPPPPAPKPDAVSRARFQQLFPMDIASQTMTQTTPPMKSGIGSLV